MIEDIVEIAVVASDMTLNEAAKNHRSARIMRAIIGLLCIALIVAAIYVTFKYS